MPELTVSAPIWDPLKQQWTTRPERLTDHLVEATWATGNEVETARIRLAFARLVALLISKGHLTTHEALGLVDSNATSAPGQE